MTTKHLQPSGRWGDMPSTDQYIGHADMTPWEREYRKYDQMHSYVILSEWTERDRDFMAYWNLQLQQKLEELGHPSAKPIMAITRWHQPIWRDGQPPGDAPADKWTEYDAETAALWDRLPQDEIDAIRGMTVEDKEARAAWEATPPEDRPKAKRISYGRHADGRLIDEHGDTIGRWKEPEGSILDKVLAWAGETHHGPTHVLRWQRAAVGMGHDGFPGIDAMTAAEASEMATRFMRSRWEPVARAIRDREIGFTGGAQDAEAQLEETLKVINERPDVEVRKYNPDTNTLDVLSPATVTQPILEIPPEHKDGFIEYLQVEREWAKANNGAGHPVVKHDVFGKMIEMVEAGESGSDLKNQYDQFLDWMDGRFGQMMADGSIREYKSPEAKAAEAQLAQQKALREAIPGDNAALAARTQEILEKAARDAPTPEDIAAAVAAGDWHAVAALAKAKAKAQVPPEGYVWFGWIRQGSVASGQYICIGDGEYEEAILYLASDGGREPKPRLYQQNAINGPCRVRHSHDWNDCRREGPVLKTWEEIRAEYGNI